MQQNESNPNPKQSFKEWLEKLQQESWQLELLISGFAIYGIYASKDFIAQLDYYTDNNLSGELRLLGFIIVFILQKGWIIFFLNLLVHVILRGLWIGAIGLRYVSGDIDYKSLNYSETFSGYLKRKVGSFDDFIESMEKSCSVIFAYTFLLFLLLMSMMLFILEVMILVYLSQKFGGDNVVIVGLLSLVWMFFFVLGLIVFVDFIALGVLKKTRDGALSRIYLQVYRFYSFITLSFLYRPLLYNFIDNRYTRRLFFFSLPYIALVIFGEGLITNHRLAYLPDTGYQLETATGIHAEYYDDLRINNLYFKENDRFRLTHEQLQFITLEKFEVDSELTSFFIALNKDLEIEMANKSLLTPFRNKGFNFSFLQKINKDPYTQNIQKAMSQDMKELYEKRRNAKREFQKSGNDATQKYLDSLVMEINDREMGWRIKIEETKKAAAEKILKTYLSFFTVYLDEQILPVQKCFFTRHPHNNEEGIRCYVHLDSISRGLHTFKFVRNFNPDNQASEAKMLYLPIIKK